ncbi:hypothetical protein CCMSSC00406_0007124 [Pleurotus cornucopiae]|uniref:Uncharacterized protein n=1 Tax=Pleurotus cornucopiae TaxID=5321 RepID=A0ACB7IQU0_PLECO|nr:hypothetical protein CCMSSC00406_0007124 [Pleurotus cornucopiae]
MSFTKVASIHPHVVMAAIPSPTLSPHTKKILYGLQPPSNPPTIADVAKASLALHKVMNSQFHNPTNIPDDDITNLVTYKASVVAAFSGGPLQQALQVALPAALPDALPAALAAAIAAALAPTNDRLQAIEGQLGAIQVQLGAVEGRLGAVEGRLGAVEERLDELQTALGKTRRIVAKDANVLHADEPDALLEVVPFANGDDPTLPPHSLPAITSVRAIGQLTVNDRDKYFDKYRGRRGGQRPNVSERRKEIARAIGVMNYIDVPSDADD